MLLKRLWRDQRGFVATTDLILIVTICALGTVVGLATVRNQVVQEFGDLATALGRLSQGYSYTGNVVGDPTSTDPDASYATVDGSDYTDETDYCEVEDQPEQAPADINVAVSPANEGSM